MDPLTSQQDPARAPLAEPILVTGSNGFIGAKVVEILIRRGFSNLRCFIRPSSSPRRLEDAIASAAPAKPPTVIAGDLMSTQDCQRAAEGVSIIYHLAAGMDKSFAGSFMNSVLATRNLIEAFIQYGKPRRLVSVSSFAVYSNLKMRRGTLLDESCPLENLPHRRGDAYAFGKLKQEQLVREYGARRGLRYVILRPGVVFGPGRQTLSGRIGIDTFGGFIHLGGSNRLPLTFVDNCAEAIVLAGIEPAIDGETFNIVDDDLPTSRQFLRAYTRRLGKFFAMPMPYPVAYALSALWEIYSLKSHGQLPLVFNRRRCAAEWKGHRYSNEKLRDRLHWKPRVPMHEAMDAFLSQFEPHTS